MKKYCLFLIVLSLIMMPVSARAGMVGTPDPVEKHLIENQRLQQEIMKDINKPAKPAQPASKVEKSGSNWWKWALGAAILGGAIAAAGSGSSGSKDKGENSGGTIDVGW